VYPKIDGDLTLEENMQLFLLKDKIQSEREVMDREKKNGEEERERKLL